ncbi:hypothetical protein D1867_10990 [Acidianus infernus]|uniref:Type IV pilin n=1 Tax=Acidianus infernus TaxID=12915 RepID=A0A6A9QHG0_ACIIN|nr:hypothetical protein [Acidianus infernus]MUM65755.1 hypothetical protein [Acidianus infernus]
MENSVSVFMILVATLIIGLIIFALASTYSAVVTGNASISSYASSVAQGLYISTTCPVVSGNTYSIVIVPSDFNYNGTIYLTAIAVNPSLYGSNVISPYQACPGVNVQINGSSGKVENVILYTTCLKKLYCGEAQIWESTIGSPQIVTVPKCHDAVVWIFIQTQKGLVEVGYAWVKE